MTVISPYWSVISRLYKYTHVCACVWESLFVHHSCVCLGHTCDDSVTAQSVSYFILLNTCTTSSEPGDIWTRFTSHHCLFVRTEVLCEEFKSGLDYWQTLYYIVNLFIALLCHTPTNKLYTDCVIKILLMWHFLYTRHYDIIWTSPLFTMVNYCEHMFFTT